MISGEFLEKEELVEIYSTFLADSQDISLGNYQRRFWYAPILYSYAAIYPIIDLYPAGTVPDSVQTAYEESVSRLDRQKEDGEISTEEWYLRTLTEQARYYATGNYVILSPCYNEAWELACDADDAFTLYKDDTLSQLADAFYRANVSDAISERSAVYQAKNAITRIATFAPVRKVENGEQIFDDETHSILGFFINQRIVCDGYASLFQYLMNRAGIDCITVIGSTRTKLAAERGDINHAWNKVRIDNTWLNMDVCWSDTGFPTEFDLKTDDYYRHHQHWAVTFTDW